MGAGLAGRPPCLPHSQTLMGAGLAGRPPCLPYSQVLMDAGLAGRPPCLLHSPNKTFPVSNYTLPGVRFTGKSDIVCYLVAKIGYE